MKSHTTICVDIGPPYYNFMCSYITGPQDRDTNVTVIPLFPGDIIMAKTTVSTTPATIVQVQGVSMDTDFVNPYTGIAGRFQTNTTVEERDGKRYINGLEQNPDAVKYELGTALATGYVLRKEDIKPEKVGCLFAVWMEGKDANGTEYDTLLSLVDDTQDIIVQFFSPEDALGASAELRAKAKKEGINMTYTAVSILPTE